MGPAPAEANSPAEVYGAAAAYGPEEYDPPDGYPMAEYDIGATGPGPALAPHEAPPQWQQTETADSLTADLLLLGRTTQEPSSRDFVPLKDAQDALERTYLLQVLTATRGNVSRAAALSGKYRGDFYKLLHKHGLVPESFRDD